MNWQKLLHLYYILLDKISIQALSGTAEYHFVAA